jgi:hypothetical protein
MTWPGVIPSDFRTPIRRYWATTAPLTTLNTISAAMMRPISAYAMTSGPMMALALSFWLCLTSQLVAFVIASAGMSSVSACSSALTCACVLALENR